MNTKQVIIVRKDLNMSEGKTAAQVAHAAMSFLTQDMLVGYESEEWTAIKSLKEIHWIEIREWLSNSFKKIVVFVNSEEELEALHKKALDKNLISHMITDNGATEFNGVATKTCVAIGPHEDNKFENVTDGLPLLR